MPDYSTSIGRVQWSRDLLCVVETKELTEDLENLASVSLSDDQIDRLSEKIIPYTNIVSIGEDLASNL